jgi:hypothetical protein
MSVKEASFSVQSITGASAIGMSANNSTQNKLSPTIVAVLLMKSRQMVLSRLSSQLYWS